jgi:hypothetical protein
MLSAGHRIPFYNFPLSDLANDNVEQAKQQSRDQLCRSSSATTGPDAHLRSCGIVRQSTPELLLLLQVEAHMKAERLFYSSAGALFLLMMAVGFREFILHGHGQGGRLIDPGILPIVIAHGLAIATWYTLYFVQALLITLRRRKLHMTLGWAAVAVGLTIAVTGPLVAVRSVQVTPPEFHFFGMLYSRFLLGMLTEVTLFTGFVTAGLITRKKPRVHRALMTLASLALLAGSTVRMPFLYPLFGTTGWVGLYAPVFCIGAALLLIRLALTRTLDRTFAYGYCILVVALICTDVLGATRTWDQLAAAMLRL